MSRRLDGGSQGAEAPALAPERGILRELRGDDAEQVAALFVEAYGEARPLDAEEIRSWLDNEELKHELMRVLDLDGRVVGYGDLYLEPDVAALDVAAPGHWTAFLGWAEERARTDGIPRVRVYVPAGHELAALLEARGYELWRSSYTMEVDLLAPPATRAIPPGVELRTYTAGDEDAVRVAVNEAFAEDPFHHDLTPAVFREFNLKARGFDPTLWLLAWDGAEPAGFVLAYSERAGEPGLGWVGTLGVRPRWRRQGLGEALLLASFGELYARGFRRVGLGVDTENVSGALRLYERAGMRAVRRADNWITQL
jgi:mycothiol synthase